MEMIVQLSKNSMVPVCGVCKQSKGGWQPVSHEIDDPCLKSIMVSKPELRLMTINFCKFPYKNIQKVVKTEAACIFEIGLHYLEVKVRQNNFC